MYRELTKERFTGDIHVLPNSGRDLGYISFINGDFSTGCTAGITSSPVSDAVTAATKLSSYAHHAIRKLERMLRESRLYEYMLNHPDFLKIQEIASRLMGQSDLEQTPHPAERASGPTDPIAALIYRQTAENTKYRPGVNPG
ncbi:MAG: hypothetical protein R3E95_03295 [Thiolinea sp.]